ncbi:unnamed protein product [Mytilus edulis]|uniref:Uncharacterized protein n=1 Tax=Mytilus edulis TaxID=6550 RepID=A0A8S3V8N2_MYTED|nr:unnamed protein product [Mytilus edulis]
MIKCNLDPQPNGRDNAWLCAVMIDGEIQDVECSTHNKVVCQVDGRNHNASYKNTGIPATFYNQTTKHVDLETTTLVTETTGIPATFYSQTTKHVNLETTTHPSETTGIPATLYNQTTKHVDLETTTLVTETTGIPGTFYHQSTKHVNLETTNLPAANKSLTLSSLECEELWMNQSKCNCQEPSAIPEIQNDIITYRLDKTTLSSYIRKRSSASDPRKSSFYIGCVGIIVLVLSVLFIVVLDFIPRG